MSASSRAVVALILTLLGRSLRAQSAADTSAPSPKAFSGSTIDAATAVRERGARSLSEVLSSGAPGLLVVPGSGVNGMGARIRLRGVQSLVADRAPLVLLDGMRIEAGEDAFSPAPTRDIYSFGQGYVGYGYGGPVPPGPLRLDDLNPDDIESIDVLPGAASAAIYGPGAQSGVILIHTKRGRPGRPRWEGYVEGGVSAETSHWPANFGGVDSTNPNPRYQHGACTLWNQASGFCHQDYVQQFNPLEQRSPFRTSLRRQYGLSVSGGSAWGDYRVSGTFAGDAGPYASGVTSPDPNYYRRLSGRLTGRLRPWPSVELALNAARMSDGLRLPPDLPQQVAFGPSDSAGFSWSGMFRLRNAQAVERRTTTVEARWSPLPWMALHGLAGFDALNQSDTALSPYVAGTGLLGSLREGALWSRHRTLELSASATGAVSAMVSATTTFGVQQLRDSLRQEWSSQIDQGAGFGGGPVSGASQWHLGNSFGYYIDERLALGRRVAVSATVRHDHFKELQRGATYPSFTTTWVAHAARDSSILSRLAFRAAWGSAGPRPFDGVTPVFVPIGTPIPHIDPERTTSTELGADATLLRGRVDAGVTYYTARSHVFDVSLSPGVGIFSNSGTIRNRGIEATVTGKVFTGPAVGWDVTLSLWGNQNRLVDLGFVTYTNLFGRQRATVGYPVGGYWAPAIQSFADANGDGIITASEVVVGPTPVWAGTPYPTQGAMLTSEWRLGGSFRAALTLDYRAGQRLFNEAAFDRCFWGTCRAAVDPRTSLAEQARAAVPYATTGYFEDADYLKLREISLSFSPSPKLAAALRARAATITLAGRNLATWTGYSGGDPESGSYGTIIPGRPRTIADDGALPVPHSWTLRLQLVY
jgi:TonB-dependent SusC/RagA subfamily outer membrane receptor